MAIAFVRGYDFGRSTSTPWNFGNVNATGGNLLVYAIASYNSTIHTVRFNSVDLTLAAKQSSSQHWASLWYMFDPDQGTYAGTLTGTAGQYEYLTVGVYSGVDTAGLDAVTSKTQTVSTFNTSITTVADGCITIESTYCNAWGGASMSAGTDSTMRVQGYGAGSNALFEGTTRVDPAGSDTVSVVMSASREQTCVLASFAPQVDARRKIMVVT